jgi:hypothetical protein
VGYDVHITRKEHWSDEEGPSISLSEWISVVDSDPEMRLDGYAEARTSGGEVLRIENEGLSVWVAYSGHEKNGNMAWFGFFSGNVVVKNPDTEILAKMHSLAQRLSAKVQGDEGEEYGESGNQLVQEPQHSTSKKPWWKFWARS